MEMDTPDSGMIFVFAIDAKIALAKSVIYSINYT